MHFPAVIRWGILGCGDVTEVKSGPGFQRAERSQLVAVMRRNGRLAADFARRHGVPRWYDDARALVEDPDVDAIYVATPPGAHLEGVLLAAAAGKPCYVEKPLARHARECEQMVAACSAAGQKLFVAYYRRALPRFLRVRELLRSGVLGPLTGISYRHVSPPPAAGSWRTTAEAAGGGLFLDLGSHVLDFLDFCVGPLRQFHGQAANLISRYEVEDTVALTFRTAEGVPGTASWNFASPARDDTLDFFGTRGRISLSFFSTEPVRLEVDGALSHFDLPPPAHVAQPLIQTVVDDLLGQGTCPSSGESALRTSVVMDQALADYYGGRADAFWLRPATWPGRRRP